MLLLVLILVLVAFGLLLVGALSSSIVWAWVSVAVSLAAGVVLAVDWISRRSAVKAGEEPGSADSSDDGESPGDASSPDGPTTAARYSDVDPVTEVIPIIRSSAFGPPQGDFGMSGAPFQGAPTGGRTPGVDPRFDADADSQQTVMMPAVQPPGSASGPSGATPVSAPSSESSSPTVIAEPVDPSDPATGGGPVAAQAAGRADADEATVVVSAAGTPVIGEDERAVTGGGTAPDVSTGGDGADPSHVDASTSGASTSGAAAGGLAFGTGSAGPDSGSQSAAVQSGPAQAGTSQPGSVPQADVSGSAGVVGSGEQRSEVRESSPPREPSGMEAAPVSEGEPPEERPDAAAAALVAGLEDEVLVIDEQPRFHVPGCRTLLAAPLIPLPVGEAVELGFTPCGWCTPIRTLSSRYPATAH